MPEVTATNDLTVDQRDKLDQLRLYGTAYEIAAVNGTAGYRVGYGRKSKRGILEMIQADDCKAIYRLSKILNVDPHSWRVSGDRIARSGIWEIIATGRTERESIIEGELDSIYRGIR